MQIPVRAQANHARSAVRRAVSNPWLEFLERVGYVARGVIYIVMGYLALRLALGAGGAATDQAGSLLAVTRGPIGRPLLVAVVIGLFAYSLWGWVRAIFDPLRRGSDATGLAQRLGFAWSGFAYAALAFFALHLLAGGGRTTADSTQSLIRSVLNFPAGEWAAVLIGVVAIVAGIAQFIDARKAVFQRDIKVEEMPPQARRLALWLGRFGMFARGVVFTLVGWFVLQAGLHRNPAGARGYSGAFVFMLQQPYGRLLLAAVALGFVALGLHSLAMARWARLRGAS
jgi:hypothetical protein